MTAPVSGFEQFFFYLFGLLALASALLFVTRKSPVSAALWLVSTMFSLAALYILMDAQFVGAVQVLVYAGAIMVVFLFVVMLLNLGQVDAAADFRSSGIRIAAGFVGLGAPRRVPGDCAWKPASRSRARADEWYHGRRQR